MYIAKAHKYLGSYIFTAQPLCISFLCGISGACAAF